MCDIAAPCCLCFVASTGTHISPQKRALGSDDTRNEALPSSDARPSLRMTHHSLTPTRDLLRYALPAAVEDKSMDNMGCEGAVCDCVDEAKTDDVSPLHEGFDCDCDMLLDDNDVHDVALVPTTSIMANNHELRPLLLGKDFPGLETPSMALMSLNQRHRLIYACECAAHQSFHRRSFCSHAGVR